MSLSAKTFVTLNECKRFLGIDQNTSTFDGLLEQLIESATEKLEDLLGRKIKQQTVTAEVHEVGYENTLTEDGRFYRAAPTVLQLRNFPVVSITSISFDDTAQTITEGTTTGFYYTASDLLANGQIIYTAGWPVGVRNISITYSAGWSTVPYRLQVACLKMVKFDLEQSGTEIARDVLISATGSGSQGLSGSPSYRSLAEMMDALYKDLSEYLVPGWGRG